MVGWNGNNIKIAALNFYKSGIIYNSSEKHHLIIIIVIIFFNVQTFEPDA